MASLDSAPLWKAYLDAEGEGVKETRTLALEELLRWIERQEKSARVDLAFDVARQVVDVGKDLPVRMPLFRRFLLPALIEGILAKRPGCARWLAAFPLQLHHSAPEAVALPESLRNPVGLWEEALRVEPEDASSLSRLIDERARYLDYTLHELPWGVLYGADGATAEECEKLSALLEEFRGLAEKAGRAAEFEDLIEECALHYRHYRAWLISGRSCASYEAYLRTPR